MREDLYIVVHDSHFAVAELRSAAVKHPDDGELWVERDGRRLCVLFGSGRALLLLLRYEGDAGFSSRSVNVSSTPKERASFRLQNGQIDEYPFEWTYPSDTGWRDLETFAVSGLVPDDIGWHNDSDDGRSSPNESPG
jgi:hypothetical protein